MNFIIQQQISLILLIFKDINKTLLLYLICFYKEAILNIKYCFFFFFLYILIIIILITIFLFFYFNLNSIQLISYLSIY